MKSGALTDRGFSARPSGMGSSEETLIGTNASRIMSENKPKSVTAHIGANQVTYHITT